ncbi:hypothetical protein LTR36_000490 [Oleoguttula mirabilis]|uniref:2EXR domain-containing protein n=1 Tax=Oleoguttula mirabilis TaxID=1507867 RepID=A0AAV9JQ14_9PEZI|nr:hypothetical protein LTR36_000490 [Oleoguttula mirabilis]
MSTHPNQALPATDNQDHLPPANLPTKAKKKTTRNKKTLRVPNPSSPNLFMTLPAELRNAVYDYALTDRKPQNVRRHRRKPNWQEPGLLRASKEIRHEALKLYYKHNAFDIRIMLANDDFVPAITWLNTVISQTAQQPFTDVRLHIIGRVWHKLSGFATVAEFLRKTGLKAEIITTIQEDTELEQQDIARMRAGGASIFVTVSGNYVSSNRAIKDVLELGQRAHAAGLDELGLKLLVDEEVESHLASGSGRKAASQYERMQAEAAADLAQKSAQEWAKIARDGEDRGDGDSHGDGDGDNNHDDDDDRGDGDDDASTTHSESNMPAAQTTPPAEPTNLPALTQTAVPAHDNIRSTTFPTQSSWDGSNGHPHRTTQRAFPSMWDVWSRDFPDYAAQRTIFAPTNNIPTAPLVSLWGAQQLSQRRSIAQEMQRQQDDVAVFAWSYGVAQYHPQPPPNFRLQQYPPQEQQYLPQEQQYPLQEQQYPPQEPFDFGYDFNMVFDHDLFPA